MSSVWHEEVTEVEEVETGEHYIKVRGGFMLVEDYVQGGRVEDSIGPFRFVRKVSNAVLSNEYAHLVIPGG
jgi:hypothetical protein